jgi:hypothetical protein
MGPDAHPVERHDEKLVKPVCVVGQHVIKPRALGGQIGLLAEAQEDDASVGLLTPKDELAKVAVVSDEGTLLGKSQPKHSPVCQPCGIIAADPGRIVTALSEELDEARIRTLIQ